MCIVLLGNRYALIPISCVFNTALMFEAPSIDRYLIPIWYGHPRSSSLQDPGKGSVTIRFLTLELMKKKTKENIGLMLNCCCTETWWHTARRILPGLFIALHPSSQQMLSDLLSALCCSRPRWQIRFIQAKCPSSSELGRSRHASLCISSFRRKRRKWCQPDKQQAWHERPPHPQDFITGLK